MLAGVWLDVDGTDAGIRIFFELGCFVQDGQAHSFAFCTKTDSGTKSCVKCANLFSRASGLKDEVGDEQLCVDLVDERDLVKETDGDFFRACDRLENAFRLHGTTRPYTALSQVTGLRYEPEGMVWDRSLRRILRPVSQRLTQFK